MTVHQAGQPGHCILGFLLALGLRAVIGAGFHNKLYSVDKTNFSPACFSQSFFHQIRVISLTKLLFRLHLAARKESASQTTKFVTEIPSDSVANLMYSFFP